MLAPVVPTAIAPTAKDILPVEFGVVEEGIGCPISIPRIHFAVNVPNPLPSVNIDFPGARVCFNQKRLKLGWGSFNAVDWAIPILSFGIFWGMWLQLRRM